MGIMCFKPPKAPELKPLPPPPTLNDEDVRKREDLERQRMAAQGGTPATVKTDLAPAQVGGTKKVLLGV